MKKLFLSLVAAMMAATATFAQNTLVATLSHGEDISMYYGVYALRNAYNAAQSGDVINLSGGGFYSVDITKAITLRGTGIDANPHTYIDGNFTINIPAEDENKLTMEGIRCLSTIVMRGTFNNPVFVKDELNTIDYYDGNTTIKNAMFTNCKIRDHYRIKGASSVQFINSYVSGFNNESETTASAFFLNCVILPWYEAGFNRHNAGFIKSSQLLNSIVIYTASQKEALPSSTIALNCLSVNYNAFKYSQINRDCMYSSFEETFKDFTGTYTDTQTFELTDEAKATFLGDDGKEVGMYGGVLPYTSTPSYPQITKMNVANKTTADGKLSVEIEVSAAQ